MLDKEEYGFFGNIWVRCNWLQQKGDTGGGHTHLHDHVTLLVKGSVEVSVGDCPPKQFHAPTFIVIKKELRHKFVALEHDTVYYCLFAMRDVDGQVVDICDIKNMPNLPNGEFPDYTDAAPEGFWEKDDHDN